MDISSPFPKAMRALELYWNANHPQDQRVSNTLSEIQTRFLRLDIQYHELLTLNKQLLASDPLVPRISFDPSTDGMVVESGGERRFIKFNRADPSVPIRPVEEPTIISAYNANDSFVETEERLRLRYEMEILLESFYYSAHRVQKLAGHLFKNKRSGSREITLVRNCLIEHSDGGEPYSFGCSSTGPVVRPIHRPGRVWHDKGLIPNAHSFVDAIVALISHHTHNGTP